MSHQSVRPTPPTLSSTPPRRPPFPIALPVLLILLLASSAHAQFRVLIYHAHEALGYTEDRFRTQMDFLQANDYHTVTLTQLLDWMQYDEPMPIRPIVLTVDDNYILLYTSMAPILAARNQTITNFTITDSVGRETGLHYCDWDEIREMETSGAVLSYSHTKGHPQLTTLTDAEILQQLSGSMTAIEDAITSKTCDFIAYPYGDYNQTVIDTAIAVGYRAGIAVTVPGGATTVTHNTPLFEIPRIGADWGDVEDFKGLIGFNDLPPAPPGNGWTIDNTDVNFFCDRVAWTIASGGSTYGDNCRKHWPNAAAVPARWTAYLPRGGWYRVHAWWPADITLAPDAAFEIHSESGIQTIRVDQSKNAGKWNPLATVRFSTQRPADVRLLPSSTGAVAADGVWFEPVDPPAGWVFH